jgi:hypothetical protein
MLFVANCSIDVSIDDLTAPDFLRSTILATSRGVGDGQTSATVVVLLRNSSGTVVANYKPTFVFIDNSGSTYAGEGVTYSECEPTNTQGIATCRIKAITVGMKRVLFNNVAIDLTSEVFFDPPSRKGSFGQILSSAQVDQNANGYSVTSQTGAITKGLKHEVNGYIIYTHTTGGITPLE